MKIFHKHVDIEEIVKKQRLSLPKKNLLIRTFKKFKGKLALSKFEKLV